MGRFKKWMPVAVITLAACLVLIIGLAGRKQVTIIDEDREVVVSTVRTSMASALKAADIVLEASDIVIPGLETKLSDGMEIQIVRADKHDIIVDGETKLVKTTALFVEDIIAEAGIDLGDNDIVRPGKRFKVSGPSSIEIIRVTETLATDTVDMPYGTIIEVSDDLEAGQSKLVQDGVDGQKQVKYRIIYEDGVEIRRELIEETVLKDPVPEKFIRGRENLYVTSRGRPLRYQKVYIMRATAYDLSFESCGKYPDHPEYGITFSGTRARPGVVAVDPRVVKLGSKLYIESMDRTPDYGFAKAEDTGGAIKGNRVDLFIENRSQALRYGVRTVKVYVLEEPITEDMMVGYSNR